MTECCTVVMSTEIAMGVLPCGVNGFSYLQMIMCSPKAGLPNPGLPTIFRHQLCFVVHCRAKSQRTPSLSFYISITYSCIRSFEPGGREFESLRARQFLIKKSMVYLLGINLLFYQRSSIVAPPATLSHSRSIRAAASDKCSGARWAYRNTMSYDFQPPNSMSSCKPVPLITCQLAEA